MLTGARVAVPQMLGGHSSAYRHPRAHTIDHQCTLLGILTAVCIHVLQVWMKGRGSRWAWQEGGPLPHPLNRRAARRVPARKLHTHRNAYNDPQLPQTCQSSCMYGTCTCAAVLSMYGKAGGPPYGCPARMHACMHGRYAPGSPLTSTPPLARRLFSAPCPALPCTTDRDTRACS